tara:strand:+ start:33 stop:557 length:525 start_codon:yes stop_codon:yes gene_type:complete
MSIVISSQILSLEEIYIKLNLKEKPQEENIIKEQNALISIGENIWGREILLSEECAKAWNLMKQDALQDSIQLIILSGFRSYYKQYIIIQNKLNKGMDMSSILKENTLPGLSQHHSGNAIDISYNSYKLSLDFEKTIAYAWLQKNANKYGFYLSYPKNNPQEINFEPWHWYFKE